MIRKRTISAVGLFAILLLYGISHTVHLARMHTEPATSCVAVGTKHIHDFNVDCRLCHWLSPVFDYSPEAVLAPAAGEVLAESVGPLALPCIKHLFLRHLRGPPVQ